MQKLTEEQALVITGYAGVLCCSFSKFHEDVEKRLGRSVYTHEFGSKKVAEEIKEAYKSDFLEMISDLTSKEKCNEN